MPQHLSLRCVSEDDGVTKPMTITDELLTDPEKIFLLLILERAQRRNPRVHEQERLGEMVELEPAKEVEMVFRQPRTRFFSFQIGSEAVARQRHPSPVEEECLPVPTTLPEEGEEHVLVIATQEHGLAATRISQLDEAIDHVARARSAVDVVTEKHDRVGGSRRDRLEHHRQLVGTTVDVADGDEPAGAALGFLHRGRHRRRGRHPSRAALRTAPNRSRSSSTSPAAPYGSVFPRSTRERM